ncbi:MAG TPA: hypothetical protein VNP04_31965 [Alphaproteobacteria bacterium]|nr:hypothetical protein [Alphaproteobacteria bacterium]
MEDAIRRLCLAADPEEHVGRIEHEADKDEIVVTGMANYPFESFLFPPFAERDILIEVDGVASVTIRAADKLAKYSGCRHYRPNAEELLYGDPLANISAKCNALESKIESGPDAYGYTWALLGYVRVRTHLLMLEREGTVILKDLEDRAP